MSRSPYEGLPDGLLDEVIDDLNQGRIKPQPFTQPDGEFNKSIKRGLGHSLAGLSRGAEAAFNALDEPVNAAHHAELTRRAEQWIADNQPRITDRSQVKTWEDLMDLRGSQAGSVALPILSGAVRTAFPAARAITYPASIAGGLNRLYHLYSDDE